MAVATRRWRVKKLVFALVIVLLAGSVSAATLVLKGGKRLEAESFVQEGNLMRVTLANGRVVSYPMAAVDLTATEEANPIAAPVAEVRKEGLQSPFAAAKAAEGQGSMKVTDQDVGRVLPSDEDEGEGSKDEKEKAAAEKGASVQVLSFEAKPAEEGQIDLTVVVANQGDAEAGGVTIAATGFDRENQQVGTAAGTVPGKLEPGKQATVPIKMSVSSGPSRFQFRLQYQSLVELEPRKQVEGEAEPGAAAAAQPTPNMIRFQAPPNTMAPPNQVNANPMAQVPLTAPPASPPPTN